MFFVNICKTLNFIWEMRLCKIEITKNMCKKQKKQLIKVHLKQWKLLSKCIQNTIIQIFSFIVFRGNHNYRNKIF